MKSFTQKATVIALSAIFAAPGVASAEAKLFGKAHLSFGSVSEDTGVADTSSNAVTSHASRVGVKGDIDGGFPGLDRPGPAPRLDQLHGASDVAGRPPVRIELHRERRNRDVLRQHREDLPPRRRGMLPDEIVIESHEPTVPTERGGKGEAKR